MKRMWLSLLLCISASFAAEPKFGLIVEGLVPVPDAPSPFEPALGFGALGAVEARFDLDERISIAPFIGFEYTHHAISGEEDGFKVDGTFNSKFLPIGTSFQLAVTPALRIAATPEIDISLGGDGRIEASYDGETFSRDGDIKGEKSPFLLGLGIVYGTTDKSALLLGYKFATGDYTEDYKLHKFYVGGRFAM